MAKDPAFLFYPGNYLRDTQCLSEKNHMKNKQLILKYCQHRQFSAQRVLVALSSVAVLFCAGFYI